MTCITTIPVNRSRCLQLIAGVSLACASITAAVAATPEPGVSLTPVLPIRVAASTPVAHLVLVAQWVALWDGKLELAKFIIAPDFALHASLLDGRPDTAISGPAGLASWIAQSHALFNELRFTVQVGPIVDGDFAVIRWVATARYRGGMPGAKAIVGTPLRFTGTDILRIEGGKIKDYWLNADTSDLLKQLKVD
jgi:predicted ester cyclase